MKQALRYALVVGGAVVSILLFLLATASDNSGFFDRYYSWLLGLNAAVAAALLVFVRGRAGAPVLALQERQVRLAPDGAPGAAVRRASASCPAW